MDSYNVIISPKALSQLNSYIDYIQQHTLLNDQAAHSVWQDALETRNLSALTFSALAISFIQQQK